MGKLRVTASDLSFKGKAFVIAVMIFVLRDGVDGEKIPTPNEENEVVERILRKINKPAVKSIQSEDGDIIDCVDINKQPAFDHPQLKDHVVQMKPSSSFVPAEHKKPSLPPETLQLWRRNGSCPDGTIPIRRVSKSAVLRAPSPEKFGRKISHYIYHPNFTKESENDDFNANPTAVLFTSGFNYNGAQADVNLWNPYVESPDEYSSGQIWLRGGPYRTFIAIESGWIVFPQLYGDTRTRFFAYWTVDGSQGTGCFDLLCPGFVQTSKDISLGAAFDHTSSLLGYQFVLPLSIALDPNTGNWWLQYDGRTNIGYWPGVVFDNGFPLVLWGGQVKTQKTKNPHTETAMGSGRLGTQGYSLASFMTTIRIRDNSMIWHFPQFYWIYGNQYDCYNVAFSKYPPDANYFFYGGPGKGERCP
ncbi:protein neprosin-like [Aristolochia californica]|uniref:protein neprosin-like n=1 Tax=Aristolochia californica TaxID=171875 RepID=UPI0035DECFAF